MSDSERAKRILLNENLSCVILKDDIIYKSRKKGVAPIMEIINEGISAEGFYVADKVIGKAAAMLLIYCKVKEIYSPVMSEPAIEALKSSEIKFSFDESVPFIINRTGDGQCPMEEAVINIQKSEEALTAIRNKIKELSK